ncbi:MAG: hypothetical protein V7678_03800 [Brevundimonas sp.]
MSDVLRILAAPLLWLAAFSGVYGLHGLICGHGLTGAFPGEIPVARVLLIAAYLASVLLLAAVLWGLHAPRFASRSPFVTFVSRTTGWVGLVAAIWTLSPAVATTYCL